MNVEKETVSAARLTREQTRTSLAAFNWNAGLRGVYDTVCAGTTFVFVAFAASLGVSTEKMGWVTSIISIACILQILALPLSRHAARKKQFVLILAFMEPILLIATVLVVPWLVTSGVRFYVFGIAVFLAAAFANLSRPLADEWLASTIPAGLRGRYIGRRMQFLSFATVIAMVVCGQWVTWVGKGNTQGLALILAVGAVSGLLAVVVLRGATMPAVSESAEAGLRDLPAVFKTPAFVRCLLALIVINIPFFFACPYYQVFNLEIVNMPPAVIGYMYGGYYLLKIVMLPSLGRWVDRWGPRRTIIAVSIAYFLFFTVFPFSVAGRYWPLIVAWVLVALADGAYNLALLTALYASVPNNSLRPAYFALFNVVPLAFYAIGAAVAVPLLEWLKPVQFHFAGGVLGNFHIMYIACMLLVIPCTLSAWFLPDKRAADAAAIGG